MRIVVWAAALLALAATPAWAQWTDNFDSYPVGQIIGLGGWEGWNNAPAATGFVTAAQALSAPNSQEVHGTSDSVHQYSGYTSGTWIFSGKVYVPGDLFGGAESGSFFILLSQYDPNNQNNDIWVVQSRFDPNNHLFEATMGRSIWVGIPYVADSWHDVKARFYLTRDWVQLFYDNTLLDDPNVANDPVLGGGCRISRGVFGGNNGPTAIAALDLYAGSGATAVYWDNLALQPQTCRGDMNCDGVINFEDINPFVAVLSGATPCNFANVDVNGDGLINFEDINPFVAILSGGAGVCPLQP